MSQVTLGTSATPSVPTSFVTDDGVAIPSANILNLLGDDTTDNDTDGLRVIGSGNTATVQLTNRFYGTGQTVGAVTDDLITFDLGASSAIFRFWFEIVSRDDDSNNGSGYTITSTFKTDGAAATRINTPFTEEDEDTSVEGAVINMVADGNNAILRVAGVENETLDWACVGEYITI